MSNHTVKPKTTQKKKKVSTSTKWVRIIAGSIAGLLAALMLFSMILDAFFTPAAAVSQSDVNKLKDKLSEASKTKKELEKKIKNLESDQSKLKDQIETMDKRCEVAQDEIDAQNALINSLTGQIEQKTTELEQSQKKEDDQYSKMKSRVRFLVESGNLSYLEIMLSADDFADFLSRYDIVSQISSYERQLFEQLKVLKEQIAQQKKSLEEDKQENVELKATLVQKKAELDKQLNAQIKKMKDLAKAENATKDAFDDIEAEEDKIQAEMKKAIAELAKKSDYVGGVFLWPLPGHKNITDPYGMRTHPITGKYKLHSGTDIGAPRGTKIVAANAGTVITSGYSTAYGNYVVINHGGGVSTLYAHMSKRAAAKGDTVTRGQVIGYVGATGYATGNHLHFEIIKNGNYIDPMTQFK